MTKKAKTAKEKKEKGQGDLKTLFPEKKIKISKEVSIHMRPLPIGKLPLVMGAFYSILQKAGPEKDPMKVAFEAMTELFTLLPHCIVEENVALNDLPTAILPELLNTFMEQNLTKDVVGKWKDLIDSVQELGLGQIKIAGSGQ